MRNFSFLILFVCLASCKQTTTKSIAQNIIDTSIKDSGADKVANAKIEFEFRKRTYIATRKGGKFTLERYMMNDNTTIRDVLSNDGFERYKNKIKLQVADSMKTRYANSVNSVHYFSVLPYGLNDKAVHKKLLPDVTIKGKKYDKVQITFSEEGGGEDFEDVYVYWIHKETHNIDYLAYSFHVNGGGMRFREAVNERFVNGIRFVDYNNYKPTNASTKLLDLEKAFEKDQLVKVSEINLENIKVDVFAN
ncbi:MAG: deoxyribose-phosphate aldolase [Flavobacteriaceae bacterium]|nr:deoxyribose-phosphate aldolase [Flavobacteriaceae bacterium]